MRAILFILILAIVAILVALGTGFLSINQIRGGHAPQVAATGNGVTAKGGQAPAFDVQTGSVKIGTTQTTVAVPKLQVQKPGASQTAATTNNSM